MKWTFITAYNKNFINNLVVLWIFRLVILFRRITARFTIVKMFLFLYGINLSPEYYNPWSRHYFLSNGSWSNLKSFLADKFLCLKNEYIGQKSPLKRVGDGCIPTPSEFWILIFLGFRFVSTFLRYVSKKYLPIEASMWIEMMPPYV